jgi:hypothetical protein
MLAGHRRQARLGDRLAEPARGLDEERRAVAAHQQQRRDPHRAEAREVGAVGVGEPQLARDRVRRGDARGPVAVVAGGLQLGRRHPDDLPHERHHDALPVPRGEEGREPLDQSRGRDLGPTGSGGS